MSTYQDGKHRRAPVGRPISRGNNPWKCQLISRPDGARCTRPGVLTLSRLNQKMENAFSGPSNPVTNRSVPSLCIPVTRLPEISAGANNIAVLYFLRPLSVYKIYGACVSAEIRLHTRLMRFSSGYRSTARSMSWNIHNFSLFSFRLLFSEKNRCEMEILLRTKQPISLALLFQRRLRPKFR